MKKKKRGKIVTTKWARCPALESCHTREWPFGVTCRNTGGNRNGVRAEKEMKHNDDEAKIEREREREREREVEKERERERECYCQLKWSSTVTFLLCDGKLIVPNRK